MPETTDDVITGLRRRFDELTQSQKRIAELIVDDPEFVSFATVDKFAARLCVSPSTIVRFAYRIGLSGYPELQEQVRTKLLQGLRPPVGPDHDGATSHLEPGVVASSLQHDLEILAKTANRLDGDDVQRAIDLVSCAPRVRVIAGVTSVSVAQYAAITLDRVRADVVLLDGATVPGPLLDVDENDAVLAFSFPPYAKSTVETVAAARRRGASVVAVTDSPISPMRNMADVLLLAVVSGIGMQNSLVAALALANLIVNGVTAQVPGALERYGESLALMSDWNVYLLKSSDHD
jgi:DNA-binding MurR/RpiR family transcriptional regulator